jgi:hypothetical protein
MQSALAVKNDSPNELRRYEALLDMADLMVRHRTLAELFHEMAARLRQVADFKILNFSLHHPLHRLMQLHWWEGEPAADSRASAGLGIRQRVGLGAPGRVVVPETAGGNSFSSCAGRVAREGNRDLLRGTAYHRRETAGRLRVCQRKA